MSQKYFFFNWKTNPVSIEIANGLALKYMRLTESKTKFVRFFPPAVYLGIALIAGIESKFIGLQDIAVYDSKTAQTGEITAEMAKDLELFGAIVGHSETRESHNLTHVKIADKITQLLKHNLSPVICVGYCPEFDNNPEKYHLELEKEVEFYLSTISNSKELNLNELPEIIFAYEPVWAKGSGKSADLNHIEMILTLFKNSLKKYSNINQVKFLYGGSVNSSTVDQYLNSNIIDGFLIGGSSVKVGELDFFIDSN